MNQTDYPTCAHFNCHARAHFWPRVTWAAQGDDEYETQYSALLELPVCEVHAITDVGRFVTAATWRRIKQELHAQGREPGDVATLAVRFLPIILGETFAAATERAEKVAR